MEIITSHINLDFDGFASMVAAQKLHPEAQLVFSGHVNHNVHDFLSIYKDTIDVKPLAQVLLEDVHKIIIVDTKSPDRLDKIAALLDKEDIQICVYDHHPVLADDISGDFVIVENVGAVTTLLVNLIRKQGLGITPLEATLFMLGIYEDTGNLLFPTTTVHDAAAVTYLLEIGANLDIVGEFLDRPLSMMQKQVLSKLLQDAQNISINEVDVLLATAETEEFVPGLSLLTYHLGEIENEALMMVVVKMGERFQLIGRSKIDSVDVGKVMERFGGGGHKKAASASFKDSEQGLDDVVAQLRKVLQKEVKPEYVASQIMSCPVKTVPSNIPIEEAFKILLRHGHTGLPVVDHGKLVGIISRRDMDKALYHGLGHAPVKGFMTKEVVYIKPSTSLGEIQRLMTHSDIGRLPVIEDGKIVGIVTRTNVLETWHGANYSQRRSLTFTEGTHKLDINVKEKMQTELPEGIYDLLLTLSHLGTQHGFSIYIVGGFVRDLLLGVPNLDIDIVVEGEGERFARLVAEHFQGTLSVYDRFKTAKVILQSGLRLDIASARQEYYEYPAALPTVEAGEVKLRQDLYRRDFTVNALAIELSQDNFGRLWDFFNGIKDLKEGIIRVLYNLSFVEDPTRIFRAVRYEQRYGFTIGPQTLHYIKSALDTGVLRDLKLERARDELIRLLKENHVPRVIIRLSELNVLGFFFPSVQLDLEILETLYYLEKLLPTLIEELGEDKVWVWQLYLMVLLHKIGHEEVRENMKRLHLPLELGDKLILAFKIWQEKGVYLSQTEKIPNSHLYQEFYDIPLEVLAFLIVKSRNACLKARVMVFINNLRFIKSEISGRDLIRAGFEPGPQFREVLWQIKLAKLDGHVKTKKEEMALAHKLLRG